MKIQSKIVFITSVLFSFNTVHALELSSPDVVDGGHFSKQQEYGGFGCSGQNTSPALHWKDAPKGTEYFAVTVFDPDAPTGSGWWHWQMINIPKEINHLAKNAGSVKGGAVPKGALQMRNDFGEYAFGGACPPEGHGKHRYQFTVYALSEKIDVPKDASAALVAYMLNAKALAKGKMEVLYER